MMDSTFRGQPTLFRLLGSPALALAMGSPLLFLVNQNALADAPPMAASATQSAGSAGPTPSAAPTAGTSPSGAPAGATSGRGMMQQYHQLNSQFYHIAPRAVLSDPAKRAELAPQLIPILNEKLALLDSMPGEKAGFTYSNLRRSDMAMLYLLNEDFMVATVKQMLASPDRSQQIEGKLIQTYAQFHGAGADKDLISKAADAITDVDKTYPDDTRCSMVTQAIAVLAGDQAIHDRLTQVIMDTMTDKVGNAMRAAAAKKKALSDAAEAKRVSILNKPLALSGQTLDGKAFTTADLKGKVVLVDFWATWCAPCVAGLPHVKDVYSKYQSAGLEVVGVDMDKSPQTALNFIGAHSMPWTQIYDKSVPGDGSDTPVNQCGVVTIPYMLLLDKTGTVRSVTAREDMDQLIPKLLAE